MEKDNPPSSSLSWHGLYEEYSQWIFMCITLFFCFGSTIVTIYRYSQKASDPKGNGKTVRKLSKNKDRQSDDDNGFDDDAKPSLVKEERSSGMRKRITNSPKSPLRERVEKDKQPKGPSATSRGGGKNHPPPASSREQQEDEGDAESETGNSSSQYSQQSQTPNHHPHSHALLPHQQLPVCPLDKECQLVNDPDHYKSFLHHCKLFPCYHAHLSYHTRYFLHTEAQVIRARRLQHDAIQNASKGSTPRAGSGKVKRTFSGKSTGSAGGGGGLLGGLTPNASFGLGGSSASTSPAGASSVASRFSKDAPGATLIVLHFNGGQYPFYGNWRTIKVHTLRRHLQAILFVDPMHQQLFTDVGTILDDDMRAVCEYGVGVNSSLILVDQSGGGVEGPDASME